MNSVFLTGIGSVEGRMLPFTEHTISDSARNSLALLREDNFSHFVKLEGRIEGIVGSAVRNSIHEARLALDEVDALLISSETIWGEPSLQEDLSIPAFVHHRDQVLMNLTKELGLKRAFPYGIWMSACANFASSLNLAASLVSSESHSHVIVTLVDRLDSFDARIASNGMSIFSDAAVAFLVTSQVGDYQVENTVVHFSGDILSAAKEKNSMLRGKFIARALQELNQKVISKTGNRIDEYDRVVTDTSHSLQLELVSEVLKIEPRKIVTLEKSRGHAFSADCPLSLKMLKDNAICAMGERIGALNIGPWAFGFTSLRTSQSPAIK